MRNKLLLILAIILLLSGCGQDIVEGIVIDKQHHEEYVFMQTYYTGKTNIMVPMVYPERWTITVQKREINGDIKTKIIEVTAEEYEAIDAGDRWEKDSRA